MGAYSQYGTAGGHPRYSGRQRRGVGHGIWQGKLGGMSAWM